MNRTVVVVACVTAVLSALAGAMVASRSSSQADAGQNIGQPTAVGDDQVSTNTDLSAPTGPEFQALKTYPEPRIIADFALLDQAGQPFSLSRWQQRWDLVFFGFTHCPDICPSTMALMSQLLTQAELGDQLGVTFISVDPQRDRPSHLAEYVEFFNPEFDAATGPEAQLIALTHQLGVLFDIEPHQAGATAYNVDHSAAVLLINPQGRYVGQFPAPHELDAMVTDLQRMIGQ